jgi:tRNA threonylcarbamoyladenosine biosynthesis protein TsaB
MSEEISNPPIENPAILLSIDTCGNNGSVALGGLNAGKDAFEFLVQTEFTGRTHSAQLIPALSELLALRHANVHDLQAIVVARGPGSFTGIRVGLSTAKGLAEAARIPVIAVSQLALLAFSSGLPHVLAIIDAGRGQYYAGEYRAGQMLSESLLSKAEILTLAGQSDAALPVSGVPSSGVPSSGVLVCEKPDIADAAKVHTQFPGCAPVYLPPPDAAAALRFALDRFRARSFDDIETLDANYLRRSGAELFGAQDTGNKGLEASPSCH